MKQPRKLKRAEKIFLSKKRLNPDNWMVKSEEKGEITFIHKESKKERTYHI